MADPIGRRVPDSLADRILADPMIRRWLREAEAAIARGETVTLEELEQEFGHG